MTKKPEDVDKYKKWLLDNLKFKVDSKVENHYESIAARIKTDFELSQPWTDLNKKLTDYSSEYLASTGYQLLISDFKPTLVTKTFSSFFEKTFRKNVVFNKNWPEPPEGGWVTPDNWLERTNDILRTFFVVKYLDGVEFLMSKMTECFKEHSLKCSNSFEARDEGYYAVHVYTQKDFEIPKLNWETEMKSFSIELQITTQLQDVISKLTHKYYENRRVQLKKQDKKWQWNYESEEFTVNYLGHILHYLEGMIMDVRQKGNKNII
jgi:hypothetical protein